MFRLIIIAVISTIMIVPYLILFDSFMGIDNSIAGGMALFFGYIVTPIILLKIWKSKPDLDALPVDIDDPLMSEQIGIAKGQIDRFFTGLDGGKLEAYVKFPMDIEGDTEHVWGLAHSKNEQYVVVSLVSNPVGHPSEEAYERMNIPISDIEDWMLQDAHGTTQGGYTLYAMAKIYEREYGKLPKRYAKDLEPFIDIKWENKS